MSSHTLAEIKEIERKCRERLDRNPFDLDAMFTLATVMARLGNVELAIDILEALLVVNPNYPGGLRLLARLHMMMGNEEKSKECMEKSQAMSEA